MNRTVFPSALLVASLTTACAHTAAPEPAPSHPGGAEAREGIALPERVGAFSIVETQRFPEASLGTLYRYRDGTALLPDVYVYPLTRTAREGGDAPVDRARAESRLFLATLPINQRRGAFQRFRVIADGPIPAGPEGGVEGWHVAAELIRPGQVRHTHQHLFAIGDELIKVRTTFGEDEGWEAALGAFLVGLLEAVSS
jgi:hypothetical protein